MRYGPQLRHGHSRPHREHRPSVPGAGSHTVSMCSSCPGTSCCAVDVAMTGSGVVGSQWTCVRPPAPWTASKESMQSQVEVLAQRPRHLSATAPSAHSTPSASVPVPRTPAVPVWRTNRKSRACRCIVFTSAESPSARTHNRCGLWAVRTAHRPHALYLQASELLGRFCRWGLVASLARTATTGVISEWVRRPVVRTGRMLWLMQRSVCS